MDKMLANYLVQSLEILESHTTSQIRALKGMVLSAKNSPKETQTETPKGGEVDQDVEKRLESFLSDLSGVSILEEGGDVGDIRENETSNG